MYCLVPSFGVPVSPFTEGQGGRRQVLRQHWWQAVGGARGGGEEGGMPELLLGHIGHIGHTSATHRPHRPTSHKYSERIRPADGLV